MDRYDKKAELSEPPQGAPDPLLVPIADGPGITAQEHAPELTAGDFDTAAFPAPGEVKGRPLPQIGLIGKVALEQSHRAWPPVITEQLHRIAIRRGFDAIGEQTMPPFNRPEVIECAYDLALQLDPYMHSYNLIVGDDVSGRLPALLYRQLINLRRQDAGLENVATRFINGRFAKQIDLRLPPGSDENTRTLIVTEWINQGYNTGRILKAVSEDRSPGTVDIATMGLAVSRKPKIAGSGMIFAPRLDSQSKMGKILYGQAVSRQAGVYKETGSVYSSRKPSPLTFHAAKVARTRADISFTARVLYSLLPGSRPR